MENNYIKFASVTDKVGTPGRILWKEFCEANRNPQALTRKDYYPLFGNFVPKEGVENNRLAENVDFYTMAVLDYDNNIPSDLIEIIKNALPTDTLFLAYTTYNHKPESPKWRIISTFDRPVTPKEYPIIINNLIAHIGVEADKCSSAQAHIYYYAAVKPGEAPLWYIQEGKKGIVAEEWLKSTLYADYISKETGEYAGIDIATILREEFSEFFTPTDNPKRFLAVGSESGVPGVNVRGSSVYIHHTQAMPKLANRYLDVRDLALELKFNGDKKATDKWLREKGINSQYKQKKVQLDDKMNALQKLEQVVQNDPHIKGMLAWDDFKKWMVFTREYRNKDNSLIAKSGDILLQGGYDSIGLYIRKDCKIRVSIEDVLTVLKEDSYKRSFNEVKDWITKPPHDGIDRITPFWEKAGVHEDLLDNIFIKASLPKWMVGNIDMLFGNPQIAFDGFLLILGESGTGKSHIAHCFGHKWEHTTSIDTLQGSLKRDEYMSFNENIIINFDEFETFNTKDEKTIKELTSKMNFRYRAPYDRLPAPHPRKWGYMGTSNTMDIIKDPAISRRLWVILVEVDYQDKIPFMNEILDPCFRQQIWAQAYAMWERGYNYQLTKEERRAKEYINEQYKEEDTGWRKIVIDKLSESENKLDIEDVLEYIYPENEMQKTNKAILNEKRKEIRRTCKSLGLIQEAPTTRGGKRFRPWTAPGELYNKLRISPYVETKEDPDF